MHRPNGSAEPIDENMQVEALSYQLDDLTLAALAFGNEEDKPVLCLHGYLDNAASFLPLMQQVALETTPQAESLCNRRIIAVDWPGHGKSEHRSHGAHYHFFDYVSDLVALFNHNNWQSIDIIAHSMGAMVATAFAAAFPEKVKSLTLIDSLGFIYAPAEQATSQLRQGILSRSKKIKPSREFTEDTAVKARLAVCDLQVQHAKMIVQRSLVSIDPSQIASKHSSESAQLFRWRTDPRLRTISPYRLTLEQGLQLHRDIKCPVQLVYGDKGIDMVVKGLSLYSSSLTDFTAIKLAGGHHVHMEKTQQLCNLLQNFYRVNKIKTSV